MVATVAPQRARLDATTAVTTALADTDYGRLLLVKVALVAGMVALAWSSRRWVRTRQAADVRAIRRSVGGEVAVAVAVLAVTAMLVSSVPAKTALSRPFSTELQAGALLVDVTVDPAKAGPAAVHVYTLTKEGAVAEVADLGATLSLPAQDIGPITVPLQRAGRGHFAAYGVDVPIRGTWKLTVVVRTSDIDQHEASTDVPIR
jgi:copper transport protein